MSKQKNSRRYTEQVRWAFRKYRNINQLATPGVNELIIVLDGLNPKFNIGKIFRSAEIFSVKEVHLINTPIFDVAPSKGAFKRVPAKFYNSFTESYQRLKELRYQIYALAPSETNYLQQTTFLKKTAFIVGNEERGLSFDINNYSGIIPLAVFQTGLTESLNVSVCASICLYEYCKQINQITS